MKQSIIFAFLLLSVTHALNAADAVAGKSKAVMCIACHGIDGNSNNPDWPSLAGQGEKYLVKQMIDFRDGERTSAQMAPMVAGLTDQDITNIAAYFSEQKLKPSSTKEEYVDLGAQIYNGGVSGVMACTACHGPSGSGIEAAGFPRLSGQQIPYLISQLQNFKNGSRTNDSIGMMDSIAAAMSDEDIKAVANYLAGLH